MDWVDYREKLGVGFSDEGKVKYFLVKMFNFLDFCGDSVRSQIDENEYYYFCNMTGTPMQQDALYGDGYAFIIKVLHNKSTSLKEFLAYYIAFLNCQNDAKHKKFTKEHYKNLVCNMLDESHIPFELLSDKGNYFIFPKGAEEMDTALVSQPLSWLSAYPKSHTAFVKALKQYSEATAETASDVADLFRKALETFFHEFFNCNKALENCKGLYGGYLKSRNVPAEVANNLETLQQAYTNFMNGYAKHHDKSSLNVLEYVMYQTGNIIRLLITLKQAEEKQ